MTPHIEDRLLTIDEAAEVLRTTKDWFYIGITSSSHSQSVCLSGNYGLVPKA